MNCWLPDLLIKILNGWERPENEFRKTDMRCLINYFSMQYKDKMNVPIEMWGFIIEWYY